MLYLQSTYFTFFSYIPIIPYFLLNVKVDFVLLMVLLYHFMAVLCIGNSHKILVSFLYIFLLTSRSLSVIIELMPYFSLSRSKKENALFGVLYLRKLFVRGHKQLAHLIQLCVIGVFLANFAKLDNDFVLITVNMNHTVNQLLTIL